MELIDRYLHAVKFWLPNEQADDIIAELSEDIRAEMEERESSLGRELTMEEISGLLRERGRPVLVANRYLPQQHLIGPVLFPIYKFVLKIVALCYLVPWFLVWIGLIAAGADQGGTRGPHGWAATLGAMWGSLWFTAFISAGVVTIVFACLERAEAKSHFLRTWDPGKLPAVRNPRLISRASAGIELAVSMLVSVWWAENLSSPVVLHRPAATIVFAPWWNYYFWGFLSLSFAVAALACVNLMRPYWTAIRAAARLVLDGAGATLFCYLLKANILAEIVVPNVPPEKSHAIAAAINMWAARMLPVGVVVGVAIVTIDAFRVVRFKNLRPAPPAGFLNTVGRIDPPPQTSK
jgi:hypothetical protein